MCNHAAMKGVCDTPLHIFDYYTINLVVEQHATTPPWRAYAIRPYSFWMNLMITRWSNKPF